MVLLKIGDKAPDFKLKDKEGKAQSLGKSKYKVVYFYPKDNTPGCTIEAKEFTSDLKEFEKLNIQVIGISGGDEKTKTKFCDKHNLKILLLSDIDFSVSKKYGVYGKRKFMGIEYLGISRITYVLDKSNKVIQVYDKVNPKNHSKEVLYFIQTL